MAKDVLTRNEVDAYCLEVVLKIVLTVVEKRTQLGLHRTQHGVMCHRRSERHRAKARRPNWLLMVVVTRAGGDDGEIQLVEWARLLHSEVPSPGVAPSCDGVLDQGNRRRKPAPKTTGAQVQTHDS